MVHFEATRVEFQRRFQRYTQPYPSSDVAVWKTGQGRDNGLITYIIIIHSLVRISTSLVRISKCDCVLSRNAGFGVSAI